jgi:hypothetical protein
MLQGDPVLNTRHSGSTIMLFDQDQDGDFDALIGDISSRSIVFVKNGGTPDNAWITEQDANWPSYNISLDNPYFNAAFQADINNDGHLDMLAGVNSRSFAEDVDVLWYYRNKGQLPDQQYELVQKNLFSDEMLDFGSETNPAFADINADGLLDMVIGAFTSDQEVQSRVPALHLYLNTGTAVAPAFTLVDDDYLGMSQYSALPTWGLAPALGDLDKDGDVDLVVGEFNGQLFYFQNDAGPGQPISFQDVQFPFLGIDVGSASAPTIFDVNLDGMNDLVVGERNSNFSASGNCGSLNYFQNSGTTGSAFFDSDETNFPNTACFGNVILNDIPGLPVFAKPFLIRTEVGTMLLIGSDEGGIQVYRDIENQMYGTFTLENEDYAQIRDGFKTSLALADLNNNGYFECVVGNRRGGVSAYQTDLKNMTTSISVHQKELLGINISPNPASDIVNISALTDNPILSVDLYDLRGMSILQNLDFTGNQISLSAFAQGMYLLSVETSRGRLVKKLTISR